MLTENEFLKNSFDFVKIFGYVYNLIVNCNLCHHKTFIARDIPKISGSLSGIKPYTIRL